MDDDLAPTIDEIIGIGRLIGNKLGASFRNNAVTD